MNDMEPLAEVRDLTVRFVGREHTVHAVNGVRTEAGQLEGDVVSTGREERQQIVPMLRGDRRPHALEHRRARRNAHTRQCQSIGIDDTSRNRSRRRSLRRYPGHCGEDESEKT